MILITMLMLLTQAAPTKQADPPKPTNETRIGNNSSPAIPDAVIAKFWKAQSSVQAASAQKQAAEDAFNKAQTAYAEAVKGLQEACGKEFQPQLSAQGDPVCVASPKEVTKGTPKPEAKK